MKKVSKRALFPLLLAIVLLIGCGVMVVRFFARGSDWVTFPGSPHVYTNGELRGLTVTDRSGTVLQGEDASTDPTVRAAFLHLLGDRQGYIYAPMLPSFTDKLIGYDPVQGLYGQTEAASEIRLSLSAAAQTAALRAIEGRRGIVGVMNYRTGELLCAVTAPSYDPDNRPDVESDDSGRYDGIYVNRFFNLTYTPGSIFKLVTTAAALEALDDLENRSFTCEGETIIGGQKVICASKHGQISFADALAKSCNIAFGELAAELGSSRLQSAAKKLGLCESIRCDGLEAAAGRCDLSAADKGDTAWAGIGQYTVQVNALSFLRFMGMLAAGKEAAEPYLVQSVMRGDEAVYQAAQPLAGCPLSDRTLDTLRSLMRRNVQNIYGDEQFGGLNVCAKSGTAEHEGRTADAMFAGFVQDEKYPLAFVVFIEEGGAGSAVAAPIAAEVLRACVQAGIE